MYLTLGIVSLLMSILFIGQFYDPEDGDRTLFIKHKPTLKQYFYSPSAYHRFLPTKLNFNEEIEERKFQEFKRNMISNTIPIIPLILIQVTLTLLIGGIISFFVKKNFNNWQLFTHFIINIVITTFGLLYVLLQDNFFITLIFSFIILIISILSIILIDKIQK